MNNHIRMVSVIRSKIMRPDFVIKFAVCVLFVWTGMMSCAEMVNMQYLDVGKENANMFMYLLTAFSSESTSYYGILFAFGILVSDIVYEQYLTKNIYVIYGSRKNICANMLKLTAIFSLIFLAIFFLMAFVIGAVSGIEISFEHTPETVKYLAENQQFSLLRGSVVYVPKSILNYNSLIVLAMAITKYYVGLVLLAMIGFIFSVKKDNPQYGNMAILLVLFLNIAVLEYYGPWTFYAQGIQVDLSDIFNYVTLQRFFIYDFAAVKGDAAEIFGITMITGMVWFSVLMAVIYRIVNKKNI